MKTIAGSVCSVLRSLKVQCVHHYGVPVSLSCKGSSSVYFPNLDGFTSDTLMNH